MNLLYIGYWELADGLTQATIFPHLQILLDSDKINKIVFVTIERGAYKADFHPILENSKLVYKPLISKNYSNNLLNKINDFIIFPAKVKSLLREYNVKKVIARSSPAGALVCSLCKQLELPLYVESFEPHADYMYQSGTWKKWDLRYIFQKKWESQIKRYANGLIPVAENYKNKLVKEGVETDRIYTVPCSVDLKKFQFCESERLLVRKKLSILPSTIIGIYVGKFGGIYYDEDAFLLFKRLMSVSDLHIILLSPDKKESIEKKIKLLNMDEKRFSILCVNHSDVPGYLSAADFAFSLHLPSPVSFYLSPIKNGEYWACGLPIIISEGIGDDYMIVKGRGIGVVLENGWTLKSLHYFEEVLFKLKELSNKATIRQVAEQYRNITECKRAYTYFKLI